MPQNAKHAAFFMQRVAIEIEIIVARVVHRALHALGASIGLTIESRSPFRSISPPANIAFPALPPMTLSGGSLAASRARSKISWASPPRAALPWDRRCHQPDRPRLAADLRSDRRRRP